MIEDILNQTVTRQRATEVEDRYGNTVLSWDNPATAEIVGVSLQPSETTEIVEDRQVTISAFRLYAPPTADILATDRIEYQGTVYEVAAQPQKWPDPFVPDAIDHIEVALRQIDPPVP